MPRIIYISTKETRPTGGIKVIFQHVQGLRELGYDACVGHPLKGFQPDWFESHIPVVHYLNNFKVYADDTFVIPETGFNTLRLLKSVNVRKVMFCQNWFGIHQGLGDAADWRQFGVDAVLACSNVVANCVRETFDFDNVRAITCPIDHNLFHPGTKRHRIAYMPRKRKEDLRQIRNYFRLLAPDSDFEWTPIDNASQSDVAATLADAAIFLSLSKREGLGLPPLEAMASGCLVAGFHGIGGLEYAADNNGLWCGEDDLFDCALKLREACRLLRNGDPGAARMITQGKATAHRFTFEKMKADLEAFWGNYLRGASSAPS